LRLPWQGLAAEALARCGEAMETIPDK